MESGALTRMFKGHRGWVKSVSCSPDGTQIVSGSGDKTIMIWDAQNGDPVGVPLQGHRYGAY